MNHSFGMAHSFVDTIGDVDVISDAEVKFSFLETFETRQLCDNSLRLQGQAGSSRVKQGQAGSNLNLNLKSRMFLWFWIVLLIPCPSFAFPLGPFFSTHLPSNGKMNNNLCIPFDITIPLWLTTFWAIFNGVLKEIQDCFVSTLLHSVTVPNKLVPLSWPIICQTKTNQIYFSYFPALVTVWLVLLWVLIGS